MSRNYNTNIGNKSALLGNYARYPFEFVKGNGVYLYDANGKQYLDFLGGIAVTGFGHNHPVIKGAVEKQINNVWHTSNLFESSLQESVAEKLAEWAGLDNVFFCNSGTESNEAAIKFARKFGKGKYHIITALNSFHGRTFGGMSATGQKKIWDGFEPLVPGFSYVPYGDTDTLARTVQNYKDELIAVMLEPILSESGIVVPPVNYLSDVRNICTENNLLLIIDEVQAGMGRTGKFFAHQWNDIKPDIITLAKGIANGFPLGAVICTEEIGNEMKPGSHGSTFGGNPVALAAAEAVLNLIDQDLLQDICKKGELLKQKINLIKTDKIKDVRGKGLMIGIELHESVNAKTICKALLEKGVVTGTSGDTVLRILPPYIINEQDIEMFIAQLINVFNEIL